MGLSFNILQKLNELAYSKNELLNKKINENNRKQIIYHLISCYALGNSTNNFNHWTNEIYGILGDIPKLKNNKYPSFNQLVKWDLNKWSDSLYDHLRGYISVVKNKENIELDLDRQELSSFILDYYKWLYHEFEIDGTVTLDEVYDFIEYLMKKYNRNI